MNLIKMGDLWIPQSEEHRYGNYAVVDGTPDLDVSKATKALKFCTSFRTAVDVGAHFGAVSRLLARHFAKVHAFEAVPATFEILARNVAELPNVHAENLAVSNRNEELFFESTLTHSQLAHVILPGEVAMFGAKSVSLGPIAARPLDELGLSNVDFIKIDVEGFELEVVDGARETIARDRPLIMIEQAGNDEKFHGRTRDEASAFLIALGMTKAEGFRYSKDVVFRFDNTT